MVTSHKLMANAASANEPNRAAAVTIARSRDGLYPCPSSRRIGRWGEKVPPAVGAVADRFVLPEFDALGSQGSLLTLDGTGPSAVGTGLLIAQGGGLTVEEGSEGAVGESGGGGAGNLLHRIEVHVESGSVVAEGTTGDDLAPLGGELAELEEFFRSERTTCHKTPCPEVTTKPNRGVAPDDLRTRTSHGKGVHDLPSRNGS
jgi:hypothetical protein